MTAIYLTLAIASEVIATLALKSSEGFSRPLPAAIVVVGYGISFFLLALVLKHCQRRHDLRDLVGRRHRRDRAGRHRRSTARPPTS